MAEREGEPMQNQTSLPATTAQDYQARRRRLLQKLEPGSRVLLHSGQYRSRNYPDNVYPFRACSHYLYFCGWSFPGVWAAFDEQGATLYYDLPNEETTVWEGAGPDPEELRQKFGFDRIQPVAARPTEDILTVGASGTASACMTDAVVQTRLFHDPAAIAQLRQAAALSVWSHEAAAKVVAPGRREVEILAELLKVTAAHGGQPAFHPIVTVRGETLHNHSSPNTLAAGQVLLVDYGAETAEGWAGDLTRCYPVSGQWSTTQSQIYQAVERAKQAAIDACVPGAEFRQVHQIAALSLTQSLVDLEIFKGNAAELVERGVHTLVFPHGVGHLLGLDVHDMEDLGDAAGYASGRQRSQRFGDSFLRLDRVLQPDMAVTIEPGFYWIPALLENPQRTGPFADCLNLEQLQKFRDVAGIRLEEDVLVGAQGPEVLSYL